MLRPQQVDAEVEERDADHGEQDVLGQRARDERRRRPRPTTDGGAIHANSRQLTRPARMCATEAVAAATPEMPMFAPAPAAGDGRHEHDDRQPDVPEHEPDEAAREGDHEAPDRKERPLDVDRPILRGSAARAGRD